MDRAPYGPSRRLLVILALGALLQAILLWMDFRPAPRAVWGDEIMYADLASRWARGEPAALELLWPPLYPRLLALAKSVDSGLVAVRLAQVLLLFAAALLWRQIARRLTGSLLAANVTAALLLLDPQVAAFTQYLWPEALHLALCAGALWILMNRSSRPAWLALAGVLLGLCLLAKSILGVFLPAMLLPLVREAGWRRGALRAGLVAAACLLTVLPTILVNGRRGAYVIADGARFNLWVGLNDRSRRNNVVGEIVGGEYRRWQASAPGFAERERILDRKIRGLVGERGLGSVVRAQAGRQYFRLLNHDSFFTDQLPGGAIAAQGFGYRGPPRVLAAALRGYADAVWLFVLLAAGLGLAALPRKHRDWWAVLLAFVAYNLALLFWLHVKTRYRIPFLPVLDLLAGAGVAALLGGRETFGSRLVRAAAAALTALALLFAFA